MNLYLYETKNAVSGLFDLITQEQASLQAAQESHFRMDAEARRIFDCMKRTGTDSVLWIELDGFESAKKRFASEINELNKLMATLGPTYNSLAGAVLQIAKQGISSVHGSLASCPSGRTIGTSESLKNIIWQARNQSMHFEESNFQANVRSCFSNLVSDFGSHFTLASHNLALSVLDVLGWDNYVSYETDMRTLLPD